MRGNGCRFKASDKYRKYVEDEKEEQKPLTAMQQQDLDLERSSLTAVSEHEQSLQQDSLPSHAVQSELSPAVQSQLPPAVLNTHMDAQTRAHT